MIELEKLPVVIIGGGPIGLAAAAHMVLRGIPVRILEQGDRVGASIRDWGHVRLFSPWEFNIDSAARELLLKAGWQAPANKIYPTGAELLDQYVAPLAALPAIASALHLNARVVNVSRHGFDKVKSAGRERRPFIVSVQSSTGEVRIMARAVIDASGTWTLPNPLGANGTHAEGENEASASISYGIPDVLGGASESYAGKSTAVVGGGHSAANAIIDLMELKKRNPATQVTWITRSADLARVYGGGAADQLPERGALGTALKQLVETHGVTHVGGMSITQVSQDGRGVTLSGENKSGALQLANFDRVVVATGQRPDVSFLREIRIELDSAIECVKALGPLIDPNLHSCGSVRPHGHKQLSHPEAGFYTIGVKSYGRAPTFLLATGYEQARSVAAAIAGDMAAANAIKLVLPETGVCSLDRGAAVAPVEAGGCCGGPAKNNADACCVADEKAKRDNKSGCGCKDAA